MNHPKSVGELRNNIALQFLPDEHLNWILNHSQYEEYEDGEILVKTGEPTDEMIFFIEGKIDFYMNVNGNLVYYHTVENNESTGGVSGVLPYSRLKNSPGNAIAVGKTRTIKLHKKYFRELEQLNPDFIQRLIGYMTERARVFATAQMQHEKVSALGKLAAGIAHEMNNPAAAINRISEELNKRLKKNYELTKELIRYNIKPELINNIRDTVRKKEKSHSQKTKITPLQLLQKEDDINDWLEDNELTDINEFAETFVEAGFSPDDLEMIKNDSGKDAFKNILIWLENLLSSELLIKDLDSASDRITLLVSAIKSHVHMDRSGALHCTDIHKDIEDTLILLGYKIREKNITVKKIFCDDMPEVEVYIGELNQVWTNIIDNAIYAVPKDGEIIIETTCDKKNVVIKIADNGMGIPNEILSRIFDPFFTTKKVGEGTGIGLDIVKNVIKRHNGDIKVNSTPGKTEFIINIPVSQNLKDKKTKDETPLHPDN